MLPSNNMWNSQQSPSHFMMPQQHSSQHSQGHQVMYAQQPPLHHHAPVDPLAFVYAQSAQSSERELSSFLHGSVSGPPPEPRHFLGPASSGSFNANQPASMHSGHATGAFMGPPPPTNSGVTLASMIGAHPFESPHGQMTNFTFLQPQQVPVHYNQAPASPPSVMSFQQQVVSPTQLVYSQGGNSGSSHFLCVSPSDNAVSMGGGISHHQQQQPPMHQQFYTHPSSSNNSNNVVCMPGHVSVHHVQHPQSQSTIPSPQYFTAQHQQLQSTIPHMVRTTPPLAPPPAYPNAMQHGGSQYMPSCFNVVSTTGQTSPAKKAKRVKKRKAVLTPRSQAAKGKEMQAKDEEKTSKGGRPYAEEPVELDVSKKQLIVNFISHAVTENEFAQIFTQFGPISAARIIYDKHTHRSKGYGFVYYKCGEDAIKAIVHLNGMEVHAKHLKVGYASPQRDTPPSSPQIAEGGVIEGFAAISDDGAVASDDDDLDVDGDDDSDEDAGEEVAAENTAVLANTNM